MKIGDLVTPSYPVQRLNVERSWMGIVIADKGHYVDVMWSDGKVEEFWSDQDLKVVSSEHEAW